MLQFFLFSFIPIFAISQNLFQNTVKIHLIQMGLWSQIDLKILQDSIQQQYNLSKRLFLTLEKDVSQNYSNSWSSYWKNDHLPPIYDHGSYVTAAKVMRWQESICHLQMKNMRCGRKLH